MAKIQIKSEKLSPFGGIFSIMEQFDSTLSSVIDSTSVYGVDCSISWHVFSPWHNSSKLGSAHLA